jgi:2-polyprenyl-6-methoxyphenol hydroxylase-like FAD-dependent oxidoreductase
MSFQPQVVIVGAGPCGCLLALRLIRQDIRVALFEREEEIQPHFRALGYPGSTHQALYKAGIWEDALQKGFIKKGFSWRKVPDYDESGDLKKSWGELIATWNPYTNSPFQEGEIGNGMIALPQNRFREIILPKVLASDLARVYLGHTVTSIHQDSTSVTVTAVSNSGTIEKVTGSFLIGADGGKSVIRKQLGLHLEGFTWPHIAVAIDIRLNLKPPQDGPSSIYCVHPVDFAFFSIIEEAREKGPNLWRCTLVMTEEESQPGVFEDNLKQKLERLLPGVRPMEYELLRAQLYRLHQRHTTTMKSGRCLLIGDAAHLTNV